MQTEPDALMVGNQLFQKNRFPGMSAHFGQLQTGQRPQALFITCADSRIDPNLITGTAPGELFILRQAGNIVMPFDIMNVDPIAASIEYAIEILGIRRIIVCGHEDCGLVKALYSDVHIPGAFSALARLLSTLKSEHWIKQGSAYQRRNRTTAECVQEHALDQLDNLHSHPCVANHLAQITLEAWYYSIGTGALNLLPARVLGEAV